MSRFFITFASFTLLLLSTTAQSAPLLLNMCYEEQELEPYFMGAGPVPPENFPGIFIEMLQLLDERLTDANIAFHRAPWQRCLNNIKQNRADMVIASYRADREEYGVYPKTDNAINSNYAISTSEYCLFTGRPSELTWNGERFSLVPESPLAVPQGYSIIEFLEEHQLPIVKTNSSLAAMELLAKRLTVGAVTYCESGANYLWNNATRELKIQAQSPPLTARHGYLMFSKDFFANNSDLVERMWQELSMIRDSEFRSLLERYELRKSK